MQAFYDSVATKTNSSFIGVPSGKQRLKIFQKCDEQIITEMKKDIEEKKEPYRVCSKLSLLLFSDNKRDEKWNSF